MGISNEYIKISERFWKEHPNYSSSKRDNSERGKRYYNKHRNNPIFRLNYQMGQRIYLSLKKEKMGRSWKELLGYTINDLKQHLEKQFTSEMNWENWGKYWEIDHRIPKSWFKYLKAEEEAFKKCWALKNLQPLELSKNRSKKNYYSS